VLNILGEILHGILDLPYLLVGLVVESINGWIMLLALLMNAALSILPGFPEVPTLNGDVLAGVAWFLPIGAMLAIFATFVTAWILWMGVTVILRWAKAL
jgi:hypothetical protein